MQCLRLSWRISLNVFFIILLQRHLARLINFSYDNQQMNIQKFPSRERKITSCETRVTSRKTRITSCEKRYCILLIHTTSPLPPPYSHL